jgi:hypothetical protein
MPDAIGRGWYVRCNFLAFDIYTTVYFLPMHLERNRKVLYIGF